MRAALALALLATACYRDASPAPAPAPVAAEPPRAPPLVVRPRAAPLYALDEVLADALSGPLVHIGTGDWFGLHRIHACAYRNDRVIVVNIYCTGREMKSFGLVVLSPTRGRVYLYAEANAPISTLTRADYFTFKAEAAPPAVDDKLAALELGFSYTQLRAWDEARYYHYIPACFGGTEINRPESGCLSGLPASTASWPADNQPFLAAPPDAWYQVVQLLRGRAATDAR